MKNLCKKAVVGLALVVGLNMVSLEASYAKSAVKTVLFMAGTAALSYGVKKLCDKASEYAESLQQKYTEFTQKCSQITQSCSQVKSSFVQSLKNGWNSFWSRVPQWGIKTKELQNNESDRYVDPLKGSNITEQDLKCCDNAIVGQDFANEYVTTQTQEKLNALVKISSTDNNKFENAWLEAAWQKNDIVPTGQVHPGIKSSVLPSEDGKAPNTILAVQPTREMVHLTRALKLMHPDRGGKRALAEKTRSRL